MSQTKKATMKKLKPAQKNLRRRWTKALKSGKFVQTQGALCKSTPDGGREFCCLGLLCHLIDPDGWISNGEDNLNDGFGFHRSAITAEPPRSVLRAAGINSAEMTALISFNDDQDLSFVEIAEKIEANDFNDSPDDDDDEDEEDDYDDDYYDDDDEEEECENCGEVDCDGECEECDLCGEIDCDGECEEEEEEDTCELCGEIDCYGECEEEEEEDECELCGDPNCDGFCDEEEDEEADAE